MGDFQGSYLRGADRAARDVHQVWIAVTAVPTIVPMPTIKPAATATKIDTAPHSDGRSHPADMKTAGIKAAKEAIDAAATPANRGAIKIRTAIWERNARPLINKPVTMPAAINIVHIPTSLLLAARAWSASMYAPITDMTAPPAARTVFKLSFGDIDDAAVTPMPVNASSFVRDSDKSSFVIAR